MAYSVTVVADLTEYTQYSGYCQGVAESVCDAIEAKGYTVKYLKWGSSTSQARSTRELTAVLDKSTHDLIFAVKANPSITSNNMIYMQHDSSNEQKIAKYIKDAFARNKVNKVEVAKGNVLPYYKNIPMIKFAPKMVNIVDDSGAVHLEPGRPGATDGTYIARGILRFLEEIGAKTEAQDSFAAAQAAASDIQSSEPSYSLMDYNVNVTDYNIPTAADPVMQATIGATAEKVTQRIHEKQLTLHSDYLVYFDDVLMNDYILSYNANLGVDVGMGTASVQMMYAPSFNKIQVQGTVGDGVENGVQLKIFESNVFSGKYNMIFDGIIKQKTLSRDSTGFQLTFTAVDYIYWMNRIIAPISIPFNQAVSPGERLKWKAQSIDPDKTAKVEISKAGSLKGKSLQEYFDTLKEKSFLNSKVYSEQNSVTNWDDTINRVEIMGDINPVLVRDQVIDFVINSNAVFADTVYVSMSNTTNNLMMEFYQDRDGIIRIKPPFWNEPVLKDHVIDPMMIMSSSETTDWSKYYTRIIVTGGVEEWMEDNSGSTSKVDLLTPVGVYLGSLTDKNQAKWADYTSEGNRGSSYRKVLVTSGDGATPTGWVYPMAKQAIAPISDGREFGASRNGRLHAAVDLLQNPGVDVIACTSGVVKQTMYYYSGTDAIFVKNDDGSWIAYCEIRPTVEAGERITKGQVIGKTIRNTASGACMLHFEVYSGEYSGSESYENKSGSYRRRNDIIDPSFVQNLPMA